MLRTILAPAPALKVCSVHFWTAEAVTIINQNLKAQVASRGQKLKLFLHDCDQIAKREVVVIIQP